MARTHSSKTTAPAYSTNWVWAMRSLGPSNHALVYTSVRGFGDKAGGASPYMDWPAFDIVAQAMGGWMGITGEDADHPVKVGGGAGDTVSGLFAAFGTMTALWHARETGQGQYVDVAMTDSILALSELVVSQFSYRGVSPVPMGNGIPGMSPFGTVKVKDGVIAIAAPHDPQWHVLCRLIGSAATWPPTRASSTSLLRWDNNAACTEALEAFTLTQHQGRTAGVVRRSRCRSARSTTRRTFSRTPISRCAKCCRRSSTPAARAPWPWPACRSSCRDARTGAPSGSAAGRALA